MLRYKFDLKGSTAGRRVKGIVTSKTDRKDLDFLDLKEKHPQRLGFNNINRHLVMILRRDVFYLRQRGLLDYSLLLAYELSQEKFSPAKIAQQRILYERNQRSMSMTMNRDFKRMANINKQLAKSSVAAAVLAKLKKVGLTPTGTPKAGDHSDDTLLGVLNEDERQLARHTEMR